MNTEPRERGAIDKLFLQDVLGVAGDIAKQCLGRRRRGKDEVGVVGKKSKIFVKLRTLDDCQDERTLREVGILGNLNAWERWHIWEAVKGLRGGEGVERRFEYYGPRWNLRLLVHRFIECNVVSEPKRRQ